MTRELLTAAVGRAAGMCGYAFSTGFEYRLETDLGELPAVWMVAPRAVRCQGLREGVREYAVALRLIAACGEHSPEAKERQWAAMEADASRMCLMLAAEECVKSVSGVEYSPAEFTLTSRGELSLSVGFRVEMPFCGESEG